jgi:hypothetical protein
MTALVMTTLYRTIYLCGRFCKSRPEDPGDPMDNKIYMCYTPLTQSGPIAFTSIGVENFLKRDGSAGISDYNFPADISDNDGALLPGKDRQPVCF